jgi:hypothetical protein
MIKIRGQKEISVTKNDISGEKRYIVFMSPCYCPASLRGRVPLNMGLQQSQGNLVFQGCERTQKS